MSFDYHTQYHCDLDICPTNHKTIRGHRLTTVPVIVTHDCRWSFLTYQNVGKYNNEKRFEKLFSLSLL